LQGAKLEVQVLRKKFKMPPIEDTMASEVASVEKEKEALTK